ncbi:MAG TPA: transglycosylase domain-containing protein, partial [Chloroflexota bacterium]|nr:transglycosylase domain-containing protein [Chloroflexota bacterium]
MVDEEFVLAVLVARRRARVRKQRHQPRHRVPPGSFAPTASAGVPTLLALVGFFGLLSLLATLIGLAVFGRYIGALPPPEDLNAHSFFQTTPVLASDGHSLLYEITDPEGGRRTLISLDEMPRNLVEATIATEDAGFFTNPGVEPRAIVRAAFDDLAYHHIVSGASTITQQVVRGILFTPEERFDQSAARKIKEAIIAYQVTQTYRKDQILELYLNTIFYGNHSYGIQAAAEGYFGKSVESLDLAECSLLAGIPQSPGYYDPYQRLDAVKERQAYVLQRMVIEGYITPAEARAAYDEPLHFVDRRHASVAPHFVSYVTSLLDQKLGTNRLYHDGDRAVTTLDLPIQQAAEAALAGRREALAAAGATNAAIVVLDPRDGHLLALVGSLNYDDPEIEGEVNMAFVPRSSGGILSPLTYAMGLNDGETLISPLPQS